MEAGFSTPFLDIFKRGGADRDIRLLAAQGALGLLVDEQRSLLELLARDADREIARTAETTLRADPVARAAVVVQSGDEEPVDGEERKEGSSLAKIAAMNPAQRLALAVKGTREERAILIRDPNKIVALAALSSPKMTETDVERIAKMTNASDEILRIIGTTRAWAKSYGVVSALTKNPKTPLAVSMNLLSRLHEQDVKMLSVDRNVPDVFRMAAHKKLSVK